MELTLMSRIRFAKRKTAESAALKDWRVRNKRNYAMREIAREITNGKGYIIATVDELRTKYGSLCHYETATDTQKQIWGICWNDFYGNLYFFAA